MLATVLASSALLNAAVVELVTLTFFSAGDGEIAVTLGPAAPPKVLINTTSTQ